MANRSTGEKGMKRSDEMSNDRNDAPAAKRPRGDTPESRQKVRNDPLFLDISVAQFAESRADELAALTQTVEELGGTKLAFQRLPHHMRRRAMSHDIRRVPRKLRQKVQAELAKRDKKGVTKRPSRRHRRRPKCLLSEYMQRQRQHAWLETHIWHAKRFKMTTAWGYRLPLHPSDKSLRACYRATSKHCMLEDISYECCIEIKGKCPSILEALKHVTSADTGLTFAAKVTSSGQRWGEITLYTCDSYPWRALAPVTYFWKPTTESADVRNNSRQGVLWIWSHPASYEMVWAQLQSACSMATGQTRIGLGGSQSDGDRLLEATSQAKDIPETGKCNTALNVQDAKMVMKKQETKKDNLSGGTVFSAGELTLTSLKDQLVRFRLTGPAATLVLTETLQLAQIHSSAENSSSKENVGISFQSRAEVSEEMHENTQWWQQYYSCQTALSDFETQQALWRHLSKCHSPGNFPPRMMIALTIRDPRLHLPDKRGKVEHLEAGSVQAPLMWEDVPPAAALSPLWEACVRHKVVTTKLSEHALNQRRSNLLVPGSELCLGYEESRVPVLLLQRPGVQPISENNSPSTTTCVGFGSGWDLIAPRGWGMALWVALVYRGARVGGLRESCSTQARAGTLHFPCDFPDTCAGQDYDCKIRKQLEDKYSKRPPAKRCSYTRIGVPAPFHHPYRQLVSEWYQRTLGKNRNEGSSHSGLRNVFSAQILSEYSGFGLHESQGVYVLRSKRLLRRLNSVLLSFRARCLQPQRPDAHVTLLEKLMKQLELQTIPLEHAWSLVPVAIIPLLRGIPSNHAMVCIPSAEDLKMLSMDKKYSGPIESLHPRSGKSSKSTRKPRKKRKSCLQSTELENSTTDPNGHITDLQKCLLEACDRPIIGFLTNGDFDLTRGHGSGTGFCSLLGLLQLLDSIPSDGPCIVLVRNTTSRQYRLASLSIVC